MKRIIRLTRKKPGERRTRTRAQRSARAKIVSETTGAVLLTVGFTALGMVIAGPVLAVALGCLFAGAVLVAVGNL